MKTIQDCFGQAVRLTDERMAHILEHPEMIGMSMEIENVLTRPHTVRRSRSDGTVKLFMSITLKQLWVANGSVLW